MSFHLKQSQTFLIVQAMFAAGFLCLVSPAFAQHAFESPFAGLSGSWSGNGAITMTNGASERIRCRAVYSVSGTGKTVQQNLRCASDSYKLDFISNVVFEGGGISGTWAEATHNVSGSISGHAASGDIHGRLDGPGFSAGVDLSTHGDRQMVTIRPQGSTDVSNVSVTLRKPF
jgi:hypothetical protein